MTESPSIPTNPICNSKAQCSAAEQTEIDRFCTEHGDEATAVDDFGKTLLYKAAGEWGVAVVKFLVSKGAAVNAKDNQGFTPLHSAASNEDVEVVKFLVAEGADVNADAGSDGCKPLYFAAGNKNVDVIKFLVSKGANVRAENGRDSTPLHFAVCHDNADVIKFLIFQGADVNAKTAYLGESPLHDALGRDKNIKILQLLVSAGADVNAKNNEGFTPLHSAAGFMDIDVVEFLISSGADVRVKSKSLRLTPLHEAVRHSMTTWTLSNFSCPVGQTSACKTMMAKLRSTWQRNGKTRRLPNTL